MTSNSGALADASAACGADAAGWVDWVKAVGEVRAIDTTARIRDLRFPFRGPGMTESPFARVQLVAGSSVLTFANRNCTAIASITYAEIA